MASLNVQISYAGALGATYNLQALSASVIYDRGASAVPIPANTNPIFIDLGSFRCTIQISGIIDETAGTDGGVVVPSKENLEDKLNTWWASTVAVPIIITINGDIYHGKCKSMRFEVGGAKEHFWEYTLTFIATKRT